MSLELAIQQAMESFDFEKVGDLSKDEFAKMMAAIIYAAVSSREIKGKISKDMVY